MTVKITQIDEKNGTVLRVEGKLLEADAHLLERTFGSLDSQADVLIDISGVTFLDSESAHVVRRLERRGATLTGVDFFLRTVIEAYISNQ